MARQKPVAIKLRSMVKAMPPERAVRRRDLRARALALADEADGLQEQLRLATAALAYYADPANASVGFDRGERARESLAALAALEPAEPGPGA